MRTLGLAFVVCIGALSVPALAHPGGLNKEGCHNDRKNGGYHCHRAPSVAPANRPVVAASPQRSAAKSAAAVPQASTTASTAGPKCYVGPRGGTYTITASGRKNYSGC